MSQNQVNQMDGCFNTKNQNQQFLHFLNKMEGSSHMASTI